MAGRAVAGCGPGRSSDRLPVLTVAGPVLMLAILPLLCPTRGTGGGIGVRPAC